MWSLILLSILLVVGGEVFGQFEVKLGNTDPRKVSVSADLAAGITQISHISGVNLVGRSSHTYKTDYRCQFSKRRSLLRSFSYLTYFMLQGRNPSQFLFVPPGKEQNDGLVLSEVKKDTLPPGTETRFQSSPTIRL